MILVEAQDVLLGNFATPSERHAAASLGTRGVELRLGQSVDRIAWIEDPVGSSRVEGVDALGA